MTFRNQAALINSLRKKQKMTLYEFAGISKSFSQEVSNWSRGAASVPPIKAKKLAKACGVKVETFAKAFGADKSEEYLRKAGVL